MIVQLLAMVFQGVHLQMCGEVLRCLGSDTSVHIWTSPKSYAQWHLLQHFLPGISQHNDQWKWCLQKWFTLV